MAVTIDRAALAAAFVGLGDAPEARQDAILAVASALVTQWAPDAPDAAHDEAVIRCAAHLWLRQPTLTSERDDTYAWQQPVGGVSPMLSSGAAAMLAPWYVPRAHVDDDEQGES